MVQLPPGATVAPWQLPVMLKSPLAELKVGVRAMLPVFWRVTVCAVLELPYAWAAKVKELGVTVAVVLVAVAVKRGAAQMPRPYVAATRSCTLADAGEALSSTTGASGNPLP